MFRPTAHRRTEPRARQRSMSQTLTCLQRSLRRWSTKPTSPIRVRIGRELQPVECPRRHGHGIRDDFSFWQSVLPAAGRRRDSSGEPRSATPLDDQGQHTIKVGGEWMHSLNDQVFRGFFTGRYIFDSVNGFIRYASPTARAVWTATRCSVRAAHG